jgi:hypothetical protein
MAGKSLPKRCSRAGYKEKFKRYSGENRLAKNKKAKKFRHELQVEVQKTKTEEITKLLIEVCDKYNLDSRGKYALKRLIGTINTSRLRSILDKTIKNEIWFKKRLGNIIPEDKPETNAAKLIKSTGLAAFIM